MSALGHKRTTERVAGASPLPTARFFDSEKQKTDSPLDSKISKNRNTHLYRLGAKSTPGTGDFDDMGRGLTTFRTLFRRGAAMFVVCCLLFVVCLLFDGRVRLAERRLVAPGE